MRRLVMVVLLPVALAAQAVAPSDPLEALVRDSPFVPVAGASRAAAGEGGPLELRSVVFERGEFAFSVYDAASRESQWVKLGQQDLPFVARSYDQAEDVLTVDYQGRTLALKLQPAHIAGQVPANAGASPPPLPSAEDAARAGANRPANAASSNPPAPLAPPAALKPDESQRLQQMAEEIRRRRQQQPVPPPKN